MKKLQLIVSNPCSENWNEMQADGDQRYCNSCEKHIVDLSMKSDAELIQFFKKKKGSVCGRLLSSQLNRELVVPIPKTNWNWLLPFALGAMVASPVQAMDLKLAITQNDSIFPSLPAPADLNVKAPQLADTIYGSVVDVANGKPLAGVIVRQKGFKNVLAKTDVNGKFKVIISRQDIENEFTFDYLGYVRVESKLKNGMLIKLQEAQVILGGMGFKEWEE
ncbi:carboxypeptidase-like regulatory domain-containing protein [Pedobacter sp. MC2016-14]|uniref:carboxypeptidase-like regulatory domain-containing protein n=1 Tax=Pedobacter sp. MC2016-14 TaxID=2897327 RepID=UPI001E349C1A|nr:carboxypeptidase-like regulatory domain-containing protein [Pedobacter sp. MC2016-14]MCD0489931.1 carboxypeptidase-like regulatory domain-containing protein [Pedobacter sp. MC2016-14]